MKTIMNKPVLSLALTAGLIGSAGWSTASYACSENPMVSAVCIMAANNNLGDFNNTFMVANGRILPVSQYAALYSLIGNTYGGTANVSFNLPDLRGRMVLGAGQGPGLPLFPVGSAGGNIQIALTTTQLPPHVHQLTGVAVDISKLTAATTLSGLSATANLGGVAVSGPASGLELKGSSGGTLSNNPSGNSLGTTSGISSRIYSDAAPSVNMNAGSIGGNLSLTIANGTTAPVSISGSAATMIGGTATLTGVTGSTGTGQPVENLPPYLAMTYYIATNGIYPSRD